MITYTITGTRFSTDEAGVQDRVTLVLWDATKVDGAVSATLVRRGTPVPADYTPADVEYQSITEEDLVNWVIDLEDQNTIENQLDDIIELLEYPNQGSGLPYKDSFPLWAVGVVYIIGSVVYYKSTAYECIQPHTSQNTWAPPATPALWKVYVDPASGPQPWVQPLGSEDAYALGSQVTHNGHLWTSEVPANVWEPGVSGWTDEGIYP